MTRQEFHNRYKYNNKDHKIGGGAFGTVYKAYDCTLDREVAIKVQEIQEIEGKEFSLQLEYDAIKALEDHPNIANYESVYRYADGPGLYDYAIMQFYPLGNLSSYLKNNTIGNGERNKILVQILQGIAYLHHNRVVHRDIKPGNILVVNRPGVGIIPKITDFGLSKLAEIQNDYSQFQNSFAGGTVEYSSPEQLKGLSLKFNTDLWSFGIIIFEIFTGRTLFDVDGYGAGSAGKQGEIMQQIFKKDLRDDMKLLPQDWQPIAMLCLERDPEKRPSTGRELLKKLPKEFYKLEEDSFLRAESALKSSRQELYGHMDDCNEVTTILKNEVAIDDKPTVVNLNNQEVSDKPIQESPKPIGKTRSKINKPIVIAAIALVCIGLSAFLIFKFLGGSHVPKFSAMVQLEGKTGYIDSQGNSILEPTYKGGLNFKEGVAPVNTENGWNYIDIDGNLTIKGDFDLATPFSDGFALVKNNEGWFFINKDGENAFNQFYKGAKLFGDGLAPIRTSEGWSFIDKDGNIAFSGIYDDVNSFSNGLAGVKKQGKWGFIDITGEQVINFNYLGVENYSEGLFGVLIGENKWQFMDKFENVAFDDFFDQVEIFSEGWAAVKKGNKWGFIDKNGKLKIDFKYENTGNFINGIAPVKLNSKWIYIDKNNKQIIEQSYDRVEDFELVN
ncbi:WG repeat-containing protein [Arenibacter sp. ARW7G5Y1]|uniref:WG repeat-containing protein n=1 Tax=Arenibacter sp. ARW7G5Y1 TaxID=2135619 RepID=UPI000D76F5DE|nr:WG repeat-containing protein [Arenibacter sp. ARW7G5Y1]PXX31205.1 serine/threonine protein kinase [Arenibacter sp. ARW7G5Y1]